MISSVELRKKRMGKRKYGAIIIMKALCAVFLSLLFDKRICFEIGVLADSCCDIMCFNINNAFFCYACSSPLRLLSSNLSV